MDEGRTCEGQNPSKSGDDALQNLYCVENEVKRNVLECEDDIEKYVFQTSILIYRERRKTIRIEPMLGRRLQEGDSIVWGEHV